MSSNNMATSTNETCTTVSSTRCYSTSSDDLCRQSDSFLLLEYGVPKIDSAAKKLSWLRSQIIGKDIEFDSPFGRRRLTYADHTASGRSLRYIEHFIVNNVLSFYGNTHTSDSYVGHHTTKMVHEAADYIKSCLGGSREDALIFCGSGSTAAIKRLQEVMGIAVPSTLRERLIKCMGNEERWVVFVGPYEHHSNVLSWRQSLAEVIEIGLDDDGLIDINALRQQLEIYKLADRPILGSFSACSNVTGILSDTRAIARLLHHYGAFACFDFAASGPYVEIEMRCGEIDGYDAIFLSPHKFIGGPGTPGILLMNKALYQLKSSPPSTCGGGTVSYVNGFNEKDTLYLEEIEERESGGTPPIIQTIRAALAFWVKEYITYDLIEKQENMHINKAMERLLPNNNIWVLGNTTIKRQPILSFLIYSTTNSALGNGSGSEGKDGIEEGLYMWAETGNKRDKTLHGGFVAALLNDLFGIQSRAGCDCAGPYGHSLLNVDQRTSLSFKSSIQKGYIGVKPGWTRLSFPYYMSNEEFEFILASIDFLSIYGQRFLPLYHFNINTGAWTLKKNALNDLFLGKLGYNGSNNNYFHPPLHLPMAFGEALLTMEQGWNGEVKSSRIVKKYASYLENAKGIACLLPTFPPPRTITDDLDLNLSHFRV